MTGKWLGLWILFPLALLSAVLAQQPPPSAAPPAAPRVEARGIEPSSSLAPAAADPMSKAPAAPPAAADSALPGAAATRTSLPPGQSPSEDPQATVTAVFRLKSATATQVEQQLKDLMNELESASVRVAIDDRTNSVIVRGKLKDIANTQQLITELDQQAEAGFWAQRYSSAAPLAEAAPRSSNVTVMAAPALPSTQFQVQPLAAASPEYVRMEQQVADLVRAYRQGAEKRGDEHPEQKALREQVQQLVEQAFEIRQTAQQKELEQLKQRFEKVERTLTKRAENKKQIIDKRIAELLNPDEALEWNIAPALPSPLVGPPILYNSVPYSSPSGKLQWAPTAPQAVPLSPTTPVPTIPQTQNEKRMPSNFPPTLQNQLLNLTPGGGASSPPQANVANSFVSAGFEQRHTLRAAQDRVRALEAELNALKQERNSEQLAGDPNAARLQSQLEVAQKQLAELRKEFDVNLKLLQLDFESMNAELSAARQELELHHRNVQRGTAPMSLLPRLEAKVQQASLAVERAKLLLELNRQVLSNQEAEAGDAKKLSLPNETQPRPTAPRR